MPSEDKKDNLVCLSSVLTLRLPCNDRTNNGVLVYLLSNSGLLVSILEASEGVGKGIPGRRWVVEVGSLVEVGARRGWQAGEGD